MRRPPLSTVWFVIYLYIPLARHASLAAQSSSVTSSPPRLLRTLALNPSGYDSRGSDFAADLLLGDLLFHSPLTLGVKAQSLGLSCQSCHPQGSTNPQFFLPELSARPGNVDLSTRFFREHAENGIADPINIPSLRGVRFTSPYGRDGRIASLSEFVATVITSEFGGAQLPFDQLAALVLYLQDLDFLPNRNLTPTGRLSRYAPEAARQGEELFLKQYAGFGHSSCASCHIPSSFFCDRKIHRHGTGHRASPFSLDDGFETPTLLGIAESAPYFHDGRYQTLGDVVLWYDQMFELGLSADERSALTQYLRAVGSADIEKDDRPFGQRLSENLSYLNVLLDSRVWSDRNIWLAAIELTQSALDTIPQCPETSDSVSIVRACLAKIRQRCEDGESLAKLSVAVKDLIESLNSWLPHWASAAVSKPVTADQSTR